MTLLSLHEWVSTRMIASLTSYWITYRESIRGIELYQHL